jgi:hypothetical protein
MAKLKLEGLDKLLKQFKALENIDVKRALLKGGLFLQRESQIEAPVKTGYLRNSATTEETTDGVEVRFDAEYAYYVELKKPYVRPVLDEQNEEILKIIADDIQSQINKEVK